MQIIDLSGIWQLRQADSDEVIPAQVPGDTHSALLAAGKIPDPYWGDNELQVQWIGRQNWEYSRTFTISEEFLSHESVYLHLDRLDTITEIRLNDQLVGTTDNMFLRYRFEVKDLLKPGENTLTILFKSAELTAIERSKQLPYEYPHSVYPIQSPHINLIRKVPCHGGWDWGPCLMVSGIYGDVYLGATSIGRIEYVYTTQTHEPGLCTVEVTVEFESPKGGETDFTVHLAGQTLTRKVNLTPGLNKLTEKVTIANPKLWWPNGHGDQPLYDLTVEVGGDKVSKRLGLRQLEIVTEEDEIGLSFVVRVNGRDIFCKGANWIPVDALPSRHTREVMDDLLTSAQKANMNMIRVWGGGQYETDDFYELCDEKGLLVWQDMMFSCSTYPATKEFLANVREEVIHQVKRLRDHACIALWCGNNECLGALNWFEVSRKNRDRYLVDYDRLFEGTIGAAVEEADPTRIYWPSSPCGGRNDYSDNWHDDSRGDMHYWTVWHENASFEAYYNVVPRFCSEFGYQSFPSLDTIRTYAPEDQFNVTSPIMEHHQRNPAGNSKITEMMTRYFRVPEGFENFIYLSQVQQALAIKTGVEYWRHLQPTCMGTLYWQLNDNWPVASWSSLEYGGKWKLLHYQTKRSYAPLLIAAFQDRDDNVEIWLVNDHPETKHTRVTVQVRDFDGNLITKETFTAEVPAGGTRLVHKYQLNELVSEKTQGFLYATVETEGEMNYTTHFFTEYKRCQLQKTAIETAVEATEDGGYAVTLRSNKPAFFVTCDIQGIRGEFDDNFFTLLPGEPRTIVFAPKQATSLEDVRNALSVKHLRDTYR